MAKKEYARYLSSICLYPVKKENNKIMVLLQLRQNTGFADGMWEAGAAGHVDDKESATDAAVHEAKEELGITIQKTDLQFVGICNKIVKRPGDYAFYINHFLVNKWIGKIVVGEPAKCAELRWFDINNLPKNMIADRKIALENIKRGIYYSEYIINNRKTDK